MTRKFKNIKTTPQHPDTGSSAARRPSHATGVRSAGPTSTAGGRQPDFEQLIARMQRGDRDAAAAFVMAYRDRIRRRIRGKLGNAMRRLFDSQEILSTVGRRLDVYVRNGRVDMTSPEQLWALVFKMTDNALVDKARVYRRLERTEGADGPLAHRLLHSLRQAERAAREGAEFAIDTALRALPDRTDREILSMWLNERSHPQIASELGMNPATVRQRWSRITSRLREHLAPEP